MHPVRHDRIARRTHPGGRLRGRRSKYTPDRVAKIIQAIDMGATFELAAGYAGICPDTMTAWRDRYSDFSDQMREAEGRAAVKWLAKIEAAANDDWRAAAWNLEKRHPQTYGKTVSEQQHTGKDGAPITVMIAQRPDGPA